MKKQTIKITAGIGYSRSKMDFYGSSSEHVYEVLNSYSPPYDHKTFSNNAIAALLSAELMHFFNERWSLGINADYKYVVVTTGIFSIDSYYYYWDGSPFEGGERHDEALRINIPERTWNLGGPGFGVNFGFHF